MNDKSVDQESQKARAAALSSELEKAISLHEKTIPIILPFLSVILNVVAIIGLVLMVTSNPLSNYNISYIDTINEDYYNYRTTDTTTVTTTIWFIIMSILSIIALIYLIYRWIDTRNRHFDRTTKLYSLITEIIEVIGLDRAYIIKSRLNELMIVNDDMKNKALHMILGAIIPFYMLYIMHFMSKDLAKHSQTEKLILAEIIDSLKGTDPLFAKNIHDYKTIEEKSTFLYIILGIITLGIFMLYWAYAITKSYNTHILNHRVIDYEILQSLRRVAPIAN
ncbi:MAG: DUF4234 domain-containing protein [Candidatus Nitrosocaldus sp.]